MIITALPVIRRTLFELFYYCHIAFAIAMTACAFYHSGLFVVITVSVLWGGDLIIRRIIMTCRYPNKATIKRLTDTVVEISIPKTKCFDYNSGQYMFISVPELSIFQWHPFSISSSPYQQHVTFHIRKCGSWTSALHDLAGKKKEITVMLEGPYGSLGVDLTGDHYKMAMFLSGGIGVTPMQSICHQMLYEHEWGDRDLKKIWFVWTARDPVVMEMMDVVSNHCESLVLENTPSEHDLSTVQHQVVHGSTGSASIVDQASIMAERILTGMPFSGTTDAELEMELPIDEYFEDENEVESENDLPDQPYGKGGAIELDEKNQCPHSIMVEESFADIDIEANLDEVLKLDCYLTPREMKDAGITSMPFVQQGRPDMKKIFLNMREEAIKAGESRVAVCVCAPKRLVQICKMACTKYSNRKVRFDFHSEVFD